MATPTRKAPVSLDLDGLDKEDAKEPFTIRLGGKVFTLADPKDVDWRVLLDAMRAWRRGDPELAIRTVVAEGDQEAFFAKPLPIFKLRSMLDAWQAHYGTSLGEVNASSAS
jgi:hypothetical protein